MLSVRSATGSRSRYAHRLVPSVPRGRRRHTCRVGVATGPAREYSAWAVALGAADAWGRALASSNVPAPERRNLAVPMLLYSMGPSFDRGAPNCTFLER